MESANCSLSINKPARGPIIGCRTSVHHLPLLDSRMDPNILEMVVLRSQTRFHNWRIRVWLTLQRSQQLPDTLEAPQTYSASLLISSRKVLPSSQLLTRFHYIGERIPRIKASLLSTSVFNKAPTHCYKRIFLQVLLIRSFLDLCGTLLNFTDLWGTCNHFRVL